MPFEYPGNFDTRAFPAGGRIAATRAIGILIMLSFLLIGCMCGLLMWAVHSNSINPFLVTRDPITGTWRTIGRSVSRRPQYSVFQTMQESIVINFTKNWFTISGDADRNNSLWHTCAPSECSGGEILAHGDGRCALSCSASEELFDQFIERTMTDYLLRAAHGETWMMMPDSIDIAPFGTMGDNGGVWRVQATILSNMDGLFDIIAFVRIGRDPGAYPMALGYYVTDFNAYRLN